MWRVRQPRASQADHGAAHKGPQPGRAVEPPSVSTRQQETCQSNPGATTVLGRDAPRPSPARGSCHTPLRRPEPLHHLAFSSGTAPGRAYQHGSAGGTEPL